MATKTLKVARIGNSRGVRIPAETLRRYDIGDEVIMEERSDGILLKPMRRGVQKLTWEETAREMAGAAEDWSEWDSTVGDDLERLPWEQGIGKVAEKGRPYRVRKSGKSGK